MDGKGRLGMRNWEFSDHTGHTVIRGSNSELTSMDFSWVPHKNFMSSTHLQATQDSEMIETPSNQVAPESPRGDHEAKPKKAKKDQSSTKGRNPIATKAIRPKEPKEKSSTPRKRKESSLPTGKREKKNQDDFAEGGETLDFSGVPAPVCSCTGVPHQCYRWGACGWQSSCCTTSISEYPLPMSSSRPGARLAGRKMSIGTYGKLLQRLAGEGQDLSNGVDLKDHWARHGTNKFVTIK